MQSQSSTLAIRSVFIFRSEEDDELTKAENGTEREEKTEQRFAKCWAAQRHCTTVSNLKFPPLLVYCQEFHEKVTKDGKTEMETSSFTFDNQARTLLTRCWNLLACDTNERFIFSSPNPTAINVDLNCKFIQNVELQEPAVGPRSTVYVTML